MPSTSRTSSASTRRRRSFTSSFSSPPLLPALPPPPEFLVSALSARGLPSVLAYGVYLGEIVGPILIIIGVWTRLGALLIVANMIVAVLVAHTGDLFHINKQGGYALELQAMYLFVAIALAFTGAGRLSVGGRYGR